MKVVLKWEVASALLTFVMSIEVLQYLPSDCNLKKYHLTSDEAVRVVLTTNMSGHSAIQYCLLHFTLDKAGTYNRVRKNDMVVKLENANDSCEVSIDIFSGPPSENEPITTVACGNQFSWIGRVPLDNVFIQYRILNENASISIPFVERNFSVYIWYRKCQYCYSQTNGYYYIGRKNALDAFCSETVCIDNRIIRFTNALSPFISCDKCRSIEFEVREPVQLCIKARRAFDSFEVEHSEQCRVTVHIDQHRVMTLNNALLDYYCLPWDILRSKVKFTFGINDYWNCRGSSRINKCNVWIKTNTTQRHSSVCPKRPNPTTTTEVSVWSSWSSSNDHDYEDAGFGMTTVFIIAGIGCTITCICVIVCKLMFVDKRSTGEARASFLQSEVYRLRTLRHETRLSSSERLQVTDERTNIRSSTPHDQLTTSTWQNDTNPQLSLTLSANDTVESFTTSGGDDSRHFSDPPPSYDEVCKNYHVLAK